MHWIYLKGTVGLSLSIGLCGKVSEVKRFLQFETIFRTFNTKFSSASRGYAPRPPLLGSPSTSKPYVQACLTYFKFLAMPMT